MKVLFALSECRPFCASGGLSDVGGSLPVALAQNAEIGVVMPFYRTIRENYNPELIKNEIVVLDWRHQPVKVYHLEMNKVNYYFIDCPRYFDRDSLYGYEDDIERFAFFSRVVVELLAYDFDIIHCHDWQTALIPSLLKAYGMRRPTVLTIHNIEYQGKFRREHLKDLTGLFGDFQTVFDWDWGANLLKGGIVHCDRLTTVSPTYAQQIKDSLYGSGLEGIINANSYKLSGILNGIDCKSHNPSTDTKIAKKYKVTNMEGKLQCKRDLQNFLGLPQTDAPLFVMVSRFASHKGLDLVREVLPDFLSNNVQFAVLGTGEAQYQDFFNSLCWRNNFAVYIGFNDALARKMYAGGDFFVMPSKSEPCGLSQMIACRYGTLPIVRAVGGLKDSIESSYGILFEHYDTYGLRWALNKAREIYSSPEDFEQMRGTAMSVDFSWKKSAKEYYNIYKQLLK